MSQHTHLPIAAFVLGAAGGLAVLCLLTHYAIQHRSENPPPAHPAETASAADFRRCAERIAHLYNHGRPAEQGLAIARETLGEEVPRTQRIKKFLAEHPTMPVP